MNVYFSANGWEDYLFWKNHDIKTSGKIDRLIKDIQRTPFKGLGKPEPLKYDLSGYWSRRIDGEHRLVYAACEDNVFIVACRYHY